MLGDDLRGLAFMLKAPGPVPGLRFREGRWRILMRFRPYIFIKLLIPVNLKLIVASKDSSN